MEELWVFEAPEKGTEKAVKDHKELQEGLSALWDSNVE
jgi:hypothetical protein